MAHRRGAAAVANHLAEGVLQPVTLHLQGGKHEVFLAIEMLVEGGLADADVSQHLLEADVAETVAVEAPDRCLGQSLTCR